MIRNPVDNKIIALIRKVEHDTAILHGNAHTENAPIELMRPKKRNTTSTVDKERVEIVNMLDDSLQHTERRLVLMMKLPGKTRRTVWIRCPL